MDDVNGNLIYFFQVKLNNPLMGTEIKGVYYGQTTTSSGNVKLNNPLMGTETSLIEISKALAKFQALN